MKKKNLFVKSALAFGLMVLVVFIGAPSHGATWDYYLKAGATTIPAGAYNASPAIPDEMVLMWGYAICDPTFTTCGSLKAGAHMGSTTTPAQAEITAGPPTFPGPTLIAREGDTLNIHLRNNIRPNAIYVNGVIAGNPFPSMITEVTSMVIPGQAITLHPTWIDTAGNITSTGSRTGGDTTSRVRSFTTETAADNTTTTVYTWTPLKPGTFLYESGTHPAIQVQMGLSGALRVYPLNYPNPALTPGSTAPSSGPVIGFAYDDASTSFSYELTLLFSEIDQELHYSIASGLYGTPPPAPPALPTRGQRTSAVDYKPNFFLVNGAPYTGYPALPTPIAAGTHVAANNKTLVRFLNAGLLEKMPTVLSTIPAAPPPAGSNLLNSFSVIADDGNLLNYLLGVSLTPHPYVKKQYSILLPAGKTTDVIMTNGSVAGNVPLFDRSLNLTNGPKSNGGLYVYLGIL